MISRKEILSKVLENKKALILLLISISLMFFSNVFTGSDSQPKEKNESNCYISEKKLEHILSRIKGVGEVEVFITYKNNGEKKLAYNFDNNQKTAVNFSNNSPYVVSVENPEIAGVLVVAKGAENENIKARLINCVKAVTGVSYSAISVEIKK